MRKKITYAKDTQKFHKMHNEIRFADSTRKKKNTTWFQFYSYYICEFALESRVCPINGHQHEDLLAQCLLP